jgi:hypothetical protein
VLSVDPELQVSESLSQSGQAGDTVRSGGVAAVGIAVDGFASSYEALHRYLRTNRFRGYEFDDILDSRFVRAATGGSRMLQRVAIQVGRRSPVNLRPLLGVRKLESSKASGYFVKGYLYRYLATRDDQYMRIAKRLLAWLQGNYCRDYTGVSWGNAFDFASRGGFIPKGWPTIVWTSHIAEAFDLAYYCTGDASCADVVRKAGLFIIDNVARLADDTGVCLGYGPRAATPIHNSSLLGAVTLLRAFRHGADPSYRDLAKKAISWSCARMNSDGSWYYGEGEKYRWIDNFHTAYNLDCLVAAQDIGGVGTVDQDVIDRTYGYWIHHFFARDGRPKYYHDRQYPTDIQCASQAIESLSKYADRTPQALELAVRVAGWTVEHMQKRNGAFALRRGRYVVNGLESIHWGQSTMLSALGCLLWRLKGR